MVSTVSMSKAIKILQVLGLQGSRDEGFQGFKVQGLEGDFLFFYQNMLSM